MEIKLSIIIPLFNEEDNVLPMIEEIVDALHSIDGLYEILLIDDGSQDKTLQKAHSATKQFPDFLNVLSHSENLGQGLAIRTGLESAKGENVCFLDGDRQFAPRDILLIFERLIETEYEFICGHRDERKDILLLNHLPSRIGNFIIRLVFKTNFQDVGCALKIAPRLKALSVVPFKNYHPLPQHIDRSFQPLSQIYRSKSFSSPKSSWEK